MSGSNNTPNNTPNNTIVAPSGRQTIREATQMHAALCAALAAGTDDVVLDCAGVTDVDLSFIQLIIASAASAGGRFRLAAPPRDGLADALRRGGFNPASADPAAWTMPSVEAAA